MPREARIDLCGVALAMTHAQGALHHIIIRGIKRKAIFKDCADRDNFVERLGRVIPESKPDCDTRHRSAFASLS
jgi:putative transposase